jgi:hypothetical protein
VVNVEAITKVIDKIRNEENFFSMVDFIVRDYQLEDVELFFENYAQKPPACGTPACIGGWTGKIMGVDSLSVPDEVLGEFLGIDESSANALFYPEYDHKSITRGQAIAVLENLIVTETVDWGKFVDV